MVCRHPQRYKNQQELELNNLRLQSNPWIYINIQYIACAHLLRRSLRRLFLLWLLGDGSFSGSYGRRISLPSSRPQSNSQYICKKCSKKKRQRMENASCKRKCRMQDITGIGNATNAMRWNGEDQAEPPLPAVWPSLKFRPVEGEPKLTDCRDLRRVSASRMRCCSSSSSRL